MDLKISGKRAVVMAASSGLGLETAKKLYIEGSEVIICSRNVEKLKNAKAVITNSGSGKLEAYQCDVSQEKELNHFFKKINDEKPVDILVTNAGGPPAVTFSETDESDWQNAFELNLMSVVRSIKHVLPGMIKKKWGRIVTVTSVTVKQPKNELVLSNCIRAGVMNLVKTLANEYGQYNILINNVGPGLHKTSALDRVIIKKAEMEHISEEKVIEILCNEVPVKRLGEPKEIASLIAFLCSEQCTYLTGQTIIHDGGFIKGI